MNNIKSPGSIHILSRCVSSWQTRRKNTEFCVLLKVRGYNKAVLPWESLPRPVTHLMATCVPTPPIHSRLRRPTQEKMRAAKAGFSQMLELRIIYSSKSIWASRLQLLRKGSVYWRACDHHRTLNVVTIPDRYSIPQTHDVTAIV